MFNIWNILIFLGIFVGWLMIDYGLYGILYTRKIHLNAWIVRGACLVIPAVWFYLTYKYEGKVYLSTAMPKMCGTMAVCSAVYIASCSWSDRYNHLTAIKDNPNDPTKRIYANKIFNRHYNPWRDPIKFFNWIKAEVIGIGDIIKGLLFKNKPLEVKNDIILEPKQNAPKLVEMGNTTRTARTGTLSAPLRKGTMTSQSRSGTLSAPKQNTQPIVVKKHNPVTVQQSSNMPNTQQMSNNVNAQKISAQNNKTNNLTRVPVNKVANIGRTGQLSRGQQAPIVNPATNHNSMQNTLNQERKPLNNQMPNVSNLNGARSQQQQDNTFRQPIFNQPAQKSRVSSNNVVDTTQSYNKPNKPTFVSPVDTTIKKDINRPRITRGGRE